MEEIVKGFKKEFAHSTIRNQVKVDELDLKKRLLHIFSLELLGACKWADEVGVSYRTFKSFFLTDKSFTDRTINKFVICLTRFEKKHNIRRK